MCADPENWETLKFEDAYPHRSDKWTYCFGCKKTQGTVFYCPLYDELEEPQGDYCRECLVEMYVRGCCLECIHNEEDHKYGDMVFHFNRNAVCYF